MLIDGKKIAEEMLASVVKEVKKFDGDKLRLVGVLTGPSTSSGQAARKFLELKKKVAEKLDIDFKIYEFPKEITTRELRQKIVELGKAQLNNGIIVELPLPPHINTQYVLNAIPEEKDVDVLSQKAQGAFFAGRSSILPPSVEAVKTILEKHKIEIKGKNCAVFGYGLLVGKPISHWLAANGAAVSIINEFTPNGLRSVLSVSADVIISGAGKKNLITADMVKDGAVVIDFGPDVDFDAVRPKCSLITPPVGGVGPIVITSVLKNLVELSKK